MIGYTILLLSTIIINILIVIYLTMYVANLAEKHIYSANVQL